MRAKKYSCKKLALLAVAAGALALPAAQADAQTIGIATNQSTFITTNNPGFTFTTVPRLSIGNPLNPFATGNGLLRTTFNVDVHGDIHASPFTATSTATNTGTAAPGTANYVETGSSGGAAVFVWTVQQENATTTSTVTLGGGGALIQSNGDVTLSANNGSTTYITSTDTAQVVINCVDTNGCNTINGFVGFGSATTITGISGQWDGTSFSSGASNTSATTAPGSGGNLTVNGTTTLNDDLTLDTNGAAAGGTTITATEGSLNLHVGTSSTDIDMGTSNIAITASGIVTIQGVDVVEAIATNSSNIATNSSNIATNASDIQTNSSNIATNASDIQTNSSNIATNASDIQTNSSNIATNASDIQTNSSNIATNASDIQTNSSNIATNASDIQTNSSNIATNASDIQTNSTNIATNASDIQTNSTNIADEVADRSELIRKGIGDGAEGGDTVHIGLTSLILDEGVAGEARVSVSDGDDLVLEIADDAMLSVQGGESEFGNTVWVHEIGGEDQVSITSGQGPDIPEIENNLTSSTVFTQVGEVEVLSNAADNGGVELETNGNATLHRSDNEGTLTEYLQVTTFLVDNDTGIPIPGTEMYRGGYLDGENFIDLGPLVGGLGGTLDLALLSAPQLAAITTDLGAPSTGGDLTVEGDSDLWGDLTVGGDTTMTGGLTVTSDSTFTAGLSVGDNLSVGDDLTVGGTTTLVHTNVTGGLDVAGSALNVDTDTIDLDAEGQATFAGGEVDINSDNDVDVYAGNDVGITGNDDVTITANGNDGWGQIDIVGDDIDLHSIDDIDVYADLDMNPDGDSPNRITGLASPQSSTDAANKKYVDDEVDDVSDRLDEVGAMAAAFSAVQPNWKSPGNTQIALGLGYYQSEGALAAGVFHHINDNVMINAGVSTTFSDQETAGRVGITWGF